MRWQIFGRGSLLSVWTDDGGIRLLERIRLLRNEKLIINLLRPIIVSENTRNVIIPIHYGKGIVQTESTQNDDFKNKVIDNQVKQLEKSNKSLEKRVNEHEQKLNDY